MSWKILPLLLFLTACSKQYDYENPENVDDVVMLFLLAPMAGQSIFGFTPSDKQALQYIECITPNVPVASGRLTSEEVATIEDILRVRGEDPEASRPDLDLKALALSASILEKNEEEIQGCMRGIGFGSLLPE